LIVLFLYGFGGIRHGGGCCGTVAEVEVPGVLGSFKLLATPGIPLVRRRSAGWNFHE
jgi:hypothetical protein